MINTFIPTNYISFETAKLAYEKGFNIFTRKIYKLKDNKPIIVDNMLKNNDGEYPCPPLYDLQLWLREKFSLHIVIEPYHKSFRAFIYKPNEYSVDGDMFDIVDYKECYTFETYEKALEDALKETLKLVQINKSKDE